MSATEKLQDRHHIMEIAYRGDFNMLANLMRLLEMRQQYAEHYFNQENVEAREQVYQMVEYVNKDIKAALGL